VSQGLACAPLAPASLDRAWHIVFGALDSARSLGRESHPGFARCAAPLGDWEKGSGAFGKDGKPLYVNGPCDDAYGIMAKLRQAIGDARLSW
jgi:hypothetical protein